MSDNQSNNIIAFPQTQFNSRIFPQTEQEYNEASIGLRQQFCNEIFTHILSMMIHSLYISGIEIDPENEEYTKDIIIMEQSLLNLIYKSKNLIHPLSDKIEEIHQYLNDKYEEMEKENMEEPPILLAEHDEDMDKILENNFTVFKIAKKALEMQFKKGFVLIDHGKLLGVYETLKIAKDAAKEQCLDDTYLIKSF